MFFDSNGIAIHFFVTGDGPPVILGHGFASDYTVNWQNTGWIKALTGKGWKVVTLDFRGHGKSGKPLAPSDYHPHLMGGDIIRLMDHLGIPKADLFGYSMGAWISSHLMIACPERFNAVILGGLGENFLNFGDRSERTVGALTTPYPEGISDPFLKTLRSFSDLLENDVRALSACTRGVYATGTPKLENAAGPVLLITGALDDVAGQPNPITSMIPCAEQKIISDCDHLTALTRRDFKEEVISFLNRHRITGTAYDTGL